MIATGTAAPLSAAFPFKIGCGFAGGKWADYARELEAFARENKHILTVAVYQRPEDAQSNTR